MFGCIYKVLEFLQWVLGLPGVFSNNIDVKGGNSKPVPNSPLLTYIDAEEQWLILTFTLEDGKRTLPQLKEFMCFGIFFMINDLVEARTVVLY